ncbi:hypothetical protein HOG16_01910 [Candidatus Woesearchaeota archaeon]|jgi:hypothetical protein|nr:hypothetical protein [Candidatus Woesearchaeota archaeon]MBT4321675.1 hypothetical protein [Candidatus Woesearchaeota archaeon]MBT4631014.1 hypothetical protein [Candidatus Woesearchaeota archaeon]
MKTAIIALLLATVLISSCTLFETISGGVDNSEDTTDDNLDAEDNIVKEIDEIESEIIDDINLDELDF